MPVDNTEMTLPCTGSGKAGKYNMSVINHLAQLFTKNHLTNSKMSEYTSSALRKMR